MLRSRTSPQLLVVDKENGGKADALNAGLCLASGDLVCAIDADTLVEPDALMRMVRPVPRARRLRRRRRRHPRRQRLGRGARARAAGPRPAPLPAGRAARGVPARVPLRPARLEPARRQPHHLRRLRPVPARGPAVHRRLPARLGRRGHGDRGPAAAAAPRGRARRASASCPTRWRGPRCRSRWPCSAASATAGTAGCCRRCGPTAARGATRATASSARSSTRTSCSWSCSPRSSRRSAWSGSSLGLLLGAVNVPFAIAFFLFAYGFGHAAVDGLPAARHVQREPRAQPAATCCGWRCGRCSSRSATGS